MAVASPVCDSAGNAIKRCPALMVAAPASGQGKTTVVSALACLWRNRGWRVQVFKCGADFIDPGWHALASGQAVHPLDLWMVGEDHCQRLLQHAAKHNDVILVEGVMGLFDGTPSSADLAQRFGLPVLAVVDAGSMAQTLGALAYGLQHFQPGLPWAGVLANRVASAGHEVMLQESLHASTRWLGAIARNADFALPERHLGLVLASEMEDADKRLDALAEAVAHTPLAQMDLVALQQLGRIAAYSEAYQASDQGLVAALLRDETQSLKGKTIAIARDAACCFIYPGNVETLQALGAQITYFSPLADSTLPACDALWLPGGYPELHLPQLAANHAMAESVRQHVAAGKPVWAECGGMMLLAQRVQPQNAEEKPMPGWGVLPGTATMHQRLQGLGPQMLAVPGVDAPVDEAVPALRGHTFHNSSFNNTASVISHTSSPLPAQHGSAGEAVYVAGPQGNVWASYFHPWFASSPQAAAHLFLPRRAQ